MKVGLLSYHRNYNYGWNLQCYALYTTLKRLGYDVVYIDKRRFPPKTSFLKSGKKAIKDFLSDIGVGRLDYEHTQRIKGKNIAPFFEKHIQERTKPIFTSRQLKELPRFDAIVVGSDQVWRSKLVSPITSYYLDFVDYPCKKVSYAASFGTDEMEYSAEEIRTCKKYIEKFDSVSVRELGGISLIVDKYKWKVSPCVMPDPTMLLNASDYVKLVEDAGVPNVEDGDFFCYVLDKTDDKQLAIDRIREQLQITPFYIDCDLNELSPLPSVDQWLHSFMKAKFVFTDSFHGCVFSLIFRKPFLVYGNAKRGMSRFKSLLDAFGQSDRLILESSSLTDTLMKKVGSISSALIEKKQDELKNKGMNYLLNSLR